MIESKKNTLCIRIQSITMAREKNGDEDGQALYKLMNKAVCSKTMENLRNRIDVKLVNNEKRLFKACVRYFLSNFYFSPNDNPSKTMKMLFISSKKLVSFSGYSDFCISVFPSFLFPPVSHCFRG